MLSILILLAFIKLSIHYNNPIILAGSYTLINTLIVSIFGYPIIVILETIVLTMSVS